MRCSLCEKNECASGVVCAACEAHHASLREGQVRRQNIQVGEHSLAHLAWSAVAVSPGKGKARDEASSRFSFFRRRKAESLPAEAEEAPPPPDWKNRVRPAPDGLPPLHETEAEGGSASDLAAAAGALAMGEAPTELPTQTPEALPLAAAQAEAAAPEASGPPLEFGPATAPDFAAGPATAPTDAPPIEPPQAPPPALASFFESLGGEAIPAPLPASSEPEPTPDAADLMSGFLASLASPTGVELDPPQAAVAEAPQPEWTQPSPTESAKAPEGLPPPLAPEAPAPATVEAVDPSVFQSAELPPLDWSLDAGSAPSAAGDAPVLLDWAPEAQSAASPEPLVWPEGQNGAWTPPSAEALEQEAPPLAGLASEAPAEAGPDAAALAALALEDLPLQASLDEAAAAAADLTTPQAAVADEGVAAPHPEVAIAFDFLAGLREAPEASAVEASAPPVETHATNWFNQEVPTPPNEAPAIPNLAGANFFEGLAASTQGLEATAPNESPAASPSLAPAPSLPPSAFGDFFASLEAPAPQPKEAPEGEHAASDPLAGFFADLEVGESAPAPHAPPQDPSSLSWKLDQAFAAMASPSPAQPPEPFTQAPLASQFQREALPKDPPREGGGKSGGSPFTIDLGAGAKAPESPAPPPPPSRPVPQDPSDGAFSFVREDENEGVSEVGGGGGLLEGLRFHPASQASGFSYTPKPTDDDDEDEGRTIEL